MLAEIGEEELVEHLRLMLLIRRFEESLIELAGRFDVGHFHVYVGQEPTGVVALTQLEKGDLTFTTHRNHGHLLARGVEPAAMFAEILGRATGTNSGKGGTLHLASAAHGFPTTSAATGGCIPLATGAAFGFSRLGVDRVSVCLMGDGALEEGAWHESANIAALENLPIVYLCENNSLEALGQKANEYPSSTMAASPLTDLAALFGMPAIGIDGTDTRAIHETMRDAVSRARRGGGPTFVEARTVRWPGSRPLWPQLLTGTTDLRMAWDVETIPEQHRDWHSANDGLLGYVRGLVAGGFLTEEEALSVDGKVKAEIDEAREFALASPYPQAQEAWADVFA